MTARVAWALLWLLVLAIPWEKSVFVPGIGSIARLLGLAAGAAWVVVIWRRRGVRRPNLGLAAAGVFALWVSATSLWSLDPAATAARAFTFAQLLVMSYLVWDQVRTEARQRQLMAAYLAGAVVASAATVLRYLQDQQTYYRRYAAPGFDPNDLGLTVALAIPIALYLAMQSRGWLAWANRAAVAPILAAVLLTASRMALIVTALALSFVLWTWRASGRAQRVSGLALAGLFAAGALWLAPQPARERIATLGAEITRGTLHKRTTIWKAGFQALRQHPVGGVGAGAYPDAVRPWLGVPGVAGHEYVAHNAFLSIAVETGLAGLLLFGVFYSVLSVFIYMLRDPERALWAVAFAVWTVGVTTLTWEHRKPGWLLFSLIMTAWASAWREPDGAVADRRGS